MNRKTLKTVTSRAVVTGIVLAIIGVSGSVCRAAGLPRSSPESQGVSAAAVLAFVETADKTIDSLHSFMLVRHGHIVAEGWWSPYDAQSRHSLYSLSKSFTSTAVGLAIAEGKLSLSDQVLKFFPEDSPPNPSNNLKQMRIRDLLRMSTGHQIEPRRTAEEPWAKTFLAQPVPFKPGTHFLYNTSATYMASAIVQKATGMTVLDYLRPRLFDPLGIERPTWDTSPQGISTGGFGLSIRTEDIARFGQLYLQQGKWEGKQLVPEAWIAEATARQTSNGSRPDSDWDQGYGYQFWRCRHGAYRGDGAFGQFCIVMPEQDAVIAITSGTRDMQAVLNLVWDKLLPAMKPGVLAAAPSTCKKLEQTLKRLSLKPVKGSAATGLATGKRYVFPSNPHKLEAAAIIQPAGSGGVTTLLLRVDGVDYPIACGRGAWLRSKAAWGPLAILPPFNSVQPIAACGAWTAADTFEAKLCLYETPFVVTLKLRFAGSELKLESQPNAAFGPTKEPELLGKTE